MIPEIDKLTPIIYELKNYEDMAKELETNDLAIRIGKSQGLTEYNLNGQLRDKAHKAIHSIVTAEVKRLQREFKAKLKGIN